MSIASYPIAVLTGPRNAEAAQGFVELLTGPGGAAGARRGTDCCRPDGPAPALRPDVRARAPERRALGLRVVAVALGACWSSCWAFLLFSLVLRVSPGELLDGSGTR